MAEDNTQRIINFLCQCAESEGYLAQKGNPYGNAWDRYNDNQPLAFAFELGKLRRAKENDK